MKSVRVIEDIGNGALPGSADDFAGVYKFQLFIGAYLKADKEFSESETILSGKGRHSKTRPLRDMAIVESVADEQFKFKQLTVMGMGGFFPMSVRAFTARAFL